MHDIGWAVQQMRDGKRVRRSGWDGKNMHIYLDMAQGHAYEPYVVMFTAQAKYQPGWLCSQADLLATDWELAI